MKNDGFGKIAITSGTSVKSNEEILRIIIKKWKKNCPNCGKLQMYSKRWIWARAIKDNKLCISCSRIKFPTPKEGWTKLCPSCRRKMKYTNRDHLLYSIKNKCLCRNCDNKKHPRRGGKGWPKGYIVTNEHRKKLRLNRIKYLQSCYGPRVSPTYSKIACEYFDRLNKKRKWNGQHATNGGEYYVNGLGYWVDYYEPNKNVVIEYDEPSHYKRGVLLRKDVRRMEEIKRHLGCRFFRYNERANNLKEW